MAEIRVNGAAIVDWSSFHDEFQRAFRFFEGYGRNEHAWVDCMTDLHGSRSLSGLALPSAEQVEIVLEGSAALATLRPEILVGLLELVAAANEKYSEMESPVRITVSQV